jgi:hypothetical protein
MRFFRKLFGAGAKHPKTTTAAQPIRAERQPDADFYPTEGARRMVKMTYGDNVPDGVLLCSSGHETNLVHYEGAHPLGRVSCRVCDLGYSSDTFLSTAILSPVSMANYHKMADPNPSIKALYGRICAVCSLSHRANSYGFNHECSCSVLPSHKDVIFHLGSVQSFRKEPNEVVGELRNRRRVRQFEQSRPAALVEPRMLNVTLDSDLNRRNAVRRPNHPLRPPQLDRIDKMTQDNHHQQRSNASSRTRSRAAAPSGDWPRSSRDAYY